MMPARAGNPVPERLRALDLIRGVAVLGILAINIAGFAAPESATYSPNLPLTGSKFDNWAYAFGFILFEGKMRALFSILFGASLVLFIARADAAGRNGSALQLRRLLWLGLFGYLHFLLLWDGDILFLYAATGLTALGLRHLRSGQLLTAALLILALWQVWMSAMWLPVARIEANVTAGSATPKQTAFLTQVIAQKRAEDRADAAVALSGFTAQASQRWQMRGSYPLELVVYIWGETFSYVLIGMALLKSGFFAGNWPRRRLRQMVAAGLVIGGAPTLVFTAWAARRGFPEMAMHLAIGGALALPHLLLALGYAALLVLAAPRMLQSAIGLRLEAAGRMAFSNYLGTSIVMCALFSGWGLGGFGQFGAAAQWGFVLLGWTLMLGGSAWWQSRFRQGPLEWVWRALTKWRLEGVRR